MHTLQVTNTFGCVWIFYIKDDDFNRRELKSLKTNKDNNEGEDPHWIETNGLKPVLEKSRSWKVSLSCEINNAKVTKCSARFSSLNIREANSNWDNQVTSWCVQRSRMYIQQKVAILLRLDAVSVRCKIWYYSIKLTIVSLMVFLIGHSSNFITVDMTSSKIFDFGNKVLSRIFIKRCITSLIWQVWNSVKYF